MVCDVSIAGGRQDDDFAATTIQRVLHARFSEVRETCLDLRVLEKQYEWMTRKASAHHAHRSENVDIETPLHVFNIHPLNPFNRRHYFWSTQLLITWPL
jgi:hypothetical protein